MILTQEQMDMVEELLGELPDNPGAHNRQHVAQVHTNYLLAVIVVLLRDLKK